MSVAISHRLEIPPRRHVLKLFALAGVCLPFATVPALAQENNTTKGGAWLLGDNLSIAALLYNQGAPNDMTDRFLTKAKKIGDIFGIEIKPFPPKSADPTKTSVEVIHYLIEGDGAKVGVALAQKYGEDHGLLFEVAVKSNLLILLYSPGDHLGQSIAEVIKSRLQSVKLPENLWMGLVTLIDNKGSAEDVKQAVFKMHKDIANYYIPGSE